MAKPRRSGRTLALLAVLILVSVTVISLDESNRTHRLTSGIRSIASDVFSPLRSGVNDVFRPIGDFFAGAVHYGSLQQENQNLQRQLGQLRQQVAERPFEERQLQQVLALQHLPFLQGIPTVLAQSEAIDVSNFAATIDIDKGRSEGVSLGMPVVGSGGLVGQVVQANHTSATVRLITDGQSKVGVSFGSPPSNAVVDGQSPDQPLSVDFIAPGTPIHKGEVLYTNGLQSGEYPPGIPVATVSTATLTPGSATWDLTLRPSADLGHLHYVQVLLWEPST